MQSANYSATGAPGKKSMAELRDVMISEANGESVDATADFQRPVNFVNRETFTLQRTIDFNHSLEALAANPSLRTWKTHADTRFIKPGDKIVAGRVRVVGMTNSTKLPLGVKFDGLDVNRPQIIGSHYKRADVDFMLPAKTDKSVDRLLYEVTSADVAAALHPSTINNDVADMTEDSLNEGIVGERKDYDADFVISNSQLGSELNVLIQNGLLKLDSDVSVIASRNANGPSLLLVKKDITTKVKNHLLNERKNLPFRDPAAVTAELVRLDGHEFNSLEGLIDEDTPFAGIQSDSEPLKGNQISLEIEEEYIVARAVQ